MELKIEYVDINSIKPYKNNAKLHPQEQVEQIKKSIVEFGMNDPIAIAKNNIIVEGHGRLIACKELGYTEVPIIRLDHLTDEERKAYTLAHNKLTMNSDFDLDILQEELDNLETIDMSDFGFDIDLDIDEEQEIIEDEVPEVPEEPKAKLGDIYQLGNNRLMCGDSTSEEDVAKLMNGVKADAGTFLPDIEYIMYFSKKGKKIWNNSLKPTDTYKKYYISKKLQGREDAGEDLHPTMKPIELISNKIRISSNENGIVLDIFGGSGSTLIACEQLNRKCYMMELDPHYIDVIIQRWENFTGEKAVKLN